MILSTGWVFKTTLWNLWFMTTYCTGPPYRPHVTENSFAFVDPLWEQFDPKSEPSASYIIRKDVPVKFILVSWDCNFIPRAHEETFTLILFWTACPFRRRRQEIHLHPHIHHTWLHDGSLSHQIIPFTSSFMESTILWNINQSLHPHYRASPLPQESRFLKRYWIVWYLKYWPTCLKLLVSATTWPPNPLPPLNGNSFSAIHQLIIDWIQVEENGVGLWVCSDIFGRIKLDFMKGKAQSVGNQQSMQYCNKVFYLGIWFYNESKPRNLC